MYFYRIEHGKYNTGPYHLENIPINEVIHSEQYQLGRVHSDDAHPGMWYDCKLTNNQYAAMDYYCGFISFEKLIQWFSSEWMQIMHDNGFVLKIYEVKDDCVINGKAQDVFVRSEATIVDIISLQEAVQLY